MPELNGTHLNGSKYSYEDVSRIAKSVLDRVKCRPHIGIICGSGLGGLANMLEDKEVILYEDIEGFPVSTGHINLEHTWKPVPGHAGQLVFGWLHGKQVVLMKGRAHLYEGYDVHKIILPVRVMKLMGVKMLFVTNASGGINPDYNVGDIMIIKDHFNMPGFAAVNPLVGPNDDRFGPRFPPASQCYSLRLRKIVRSIGEKLGMSGYLREGVYCFLGGPSFETVTECRFLKVAGVDATGMSTVPEVLVAGHCGIEVCGISLVTNKCVMEYDSKQVANHEEVLETGEKRAHDMQKLISAVVGEL
ncbi:purine nucleoside phosphorylase-like isoform X2 [Dreissena polymorpha]|uniref:purine nucleoside phosphorylase-like isoform X2 n=1 Tax=Dreissena polymorpha TaxID=45954 RepID=UPI002263F414|nr:purine nucleoside phosphorylase-like isoform X2 [Dreissena polymorpha]XP_052286345.1 purine nucleoside phosphorylase-like isoform X2 [Dreissena polymorpha]XP_052286346.1 purine nucleoside phosphorylase-like isoform X2 [Dreissena polymorpha]XP_052286347.1 purine nucleoside phosphorylase-like isoform X2 [Dreissena polymorpha]XP_052286348.1 purine nucleoside phosphorylase-like isoform X2 [Dreissena polymorpha]